MSSNKPVYSLLESSLFMGGIKVKRDGSTCAQFPNLDAAINYLRVFLKKDSEYYKEVELVDKEGNKKMVQIF